MAMIASVPGWISRRWRSRDEHSLSLLPAGADADAKLCATVVYIVLSGIFLVRLLAWPDYVGSGQSPWPGIAFVAAQFAAMIPFTFSGPLAPNARRRPWWAPAAVAATTYLPFVFYGSHWMPGGAGPMLAAVLFTVRGRLAWAAAGAVVAADVALSVLVRGDTAQNFVYAGVATADNGITVFGLTMLAHTICHLNTTRTELASTVTATERLRAGTDLGTTLLPRLAEIIHELHQARDAAPEQAAAPVTSAVATTREALAEVRSIAGDYRAMGSSALDLSVPTPGMAKLILGIVLGGYATQTIVNQWYATAPADPLRSHAAFAACTVAVLCVTALQVRHSAIRADGPPPAARLTLALQLLLVAGCTVCFGVFGGAEAAFVAGSALLVLAGPARWLVFGASILAVAVLSRLDHRFDGGLTWFDTAYLLVDIATTGFAVYGVGRLAGVAARLEAMRRGLARTAVLRERMRVARDVHDLVGSGLSTLAVKGDLTLALLRRAPDRAAFGIEELLDIALRTRADAEAVIAATAAVNLCGELAAADALLAGLGAAPSGARDAGTLPAAADALLATVTREAVANIVKHTTPRRVTIAVAIDEAAVRLTIGNDLTPPLPVAADASGAARAAQTAEQHGRSGLVGLAERIEAVGGRFTAGAATGAGRFEVVAELPLTAGGIGISGIGISEATALPQAG